MFHGALVLLFCFLQTLVLRWVLIRSEKLWWIREGCLTLPASYFYTLLFTNPLGFTCMFPLTNQGSREYGKAVKEVISVLPPQFHSLNSSLLECFCFFFKKRSGNLLLFPSFGQKLVIQHSLNSHEPSLRIHVLELLQT